MNRYHYKAVVIVALLFMTLFAPQLHAADDVITLGVPPILPVTEMQRRWQPLIDHINQKNNLRIEMVFSESAQAFKESIIRQKPDFVILGALQVVQAKALYSPILSSSDPMHAIVLVPEKSAIQSLRDLNGKTLASPEVIDAATLLIVNAALAKENINVLQYRSNTQGTGLRALLLERADAAIADNINFSLQDPNLKSHFKIIYKSDPLPPLTIAARKNTPTDLIKKIEQAFVSLEPSSTSESMPFRNIKTTSYEQEYAPYEPQLNREAHK